jgi:hypothetical protein
MLYHELHGLMKSLVDLERETIPIPGTGQVVTNHTFESDGSDLLKNTWHGEPLPVPGDTPGEAEDRALLDKVAMARDSEIEENRRFRYHLLSPEGGGDAEGAIILLHGLNERNWAKYLPWATELCRGTGKSVVLFPTAFHMNRAPALWNDSRLMRRVSKFRAGLHPELLHSALSNAAISVRLSWDPSRFFWSGLQTYRDVLKLARLVRDGGHPRIAAGATVDFFTYSIGTFLGEIVMCADEGGLFSDSKLLAFCGGPVFNRLSPASKFIVDSEADVRLYSFLIEHLESHMKASAALRGHLSGASGPAGPWFRSFLSYRLDTAAREARLRELAPRLAATALAGDEVVPPYEVVNTLQGAARDIPVAVDVLTPGYPARHEDPFPAASPKHAGAVDACFREAFKGFSRFLA